MKDTIEQALNAAKDEHVMRVHCGPGTSHEGCELCRQIDAALKRLDAPCTGKLPGIGMCEPVIDGTGCDWHCAVCGKTPLDKLNPLR